MKVRLLKNGGFSGIEHLVGKIFEAEKEENGFSVDVGERHSLSGQLYFYDNEVEIIE